MNSTTLPRIPAIPSARLHVREDGHTSPEQLLDLLLDADARRGSTGLVYLAEHTRAADLTELPGDRTAADHRIRAVTSATGCVAGHGATPEQAAAMAEISRILTESNDPAALAGRMLARIAAEKSQPRCTDPAWCTEAGAHELHTGESVQVVQDCDFAESRKHDHTDQPYIDAKLIAEDDRDTGQRGAGAAVSFGECELTADGLRREVAKIRAALPRLEAMADTLDGKPPYLPPTDWDDAESITVAGAGVLLKVALFTPLEIDGTPNGPQVMVAYNEPSSDAELDHAGAVDFLAQLDALRSKVAVMADTLAEQATR